MTRTAPDTVKRAREAVAGARSQHFLSGFRESTDLLEQACHDLAALLPASRLEQLPHGERDQMRLELQLLSDELAQSEAVHRQAGSLTVEWARLFTEATRSEPAASYSRDGFPELVSTQLDNRREWEA